jgi:CDP-6-deoxy-D-xylo-4-hexulose-3-dehydrase
MWMLMNDAITNEDRQEMAAFILSTNKFTGGKKVHEFECQWNEWLGSKNSLFVSSGSTANFLLIASIIEKFGLKRGDKVLLPACTWMTNVAPIIQLGLEPVFCDINFENFSFKIKDMEKISIIHPDIKVIFVTHLLGYPAENDIYQSIFPKAIILNDVCEAHGARFPDGSRVGSDSLGATFSFYFGHHMTTIEGGMISTNDDDLYDIMRLKRSHGLARESLKFEEYAQKNPEIEKSFLFITDGYNFRNHEMCAVLGMSQLKKLDDNIDIRRSNYEMYVSTMNKYSDLFYVPQKNSGNSNFSFPIISKNKKTISKLKDIFKQNKIEYRPIVGGNLLSQPFLKGYSLAYSDGKNNVDIIESNGIYIGNNQFVSEDNIKLLDEILSSLLLEVEK